MRALPLRSVLFVPGDDARKMEKAASSGADAIVLDLEDAVSPERKDAARDQVRAFLDAGPTVQTWVRINPPETGRALGDLSAVVREGLAGVILPKANGAGDVERLGHWLDALEARSGLEPGGLRIIAIVTETAGAALSLGSFRERALTRLYGLMWGAEDLAADLGASSNRDADGLLSLTYRMVRAQMLLAAKAAGVCAFETPHPDFRDLGALRDALDAARREGFDGGFAIHPAQVPILNEAFTPSDEEIAHAERVVAAFAAAPDTGTVGIDGRMYDRPHLRQAERVLAMRDALPG